MKQMYRMLKAREIAAVGFIEEDWLSNVYPFALMVPHYGAACVDVYISALFDGIEKNHRDDMVLTIDTEREKVGEFNLQMAR